LTIDCNPFFQVLQRKTEEAAMATKRLKELLEARKSSARDNSGIYKVLELQFWAPISFNLCIGSLIWGY
jgi:hypothetical protein